MQRIQKKNLHVHMCVLNVFCVTNVIYVTLQSSILTKQCTEVKKKKKSPFIAARSKHCFVSLVEGRAGASSELL